MEGPNRWQAPAVVVANTNRFSTRRQFDSTATVPAQTAQVHGIMDQVGH